MLAERRLYTVKEAALFCRKSTRWVLNAIRSGQLKAIWMPQWRIAGPDLDAYIKAQSKERPT